MYIRLDLIAISHAKYIIESCACLITNINLHIIYYDPDYYFMIIWLNVLIIKRCILIKRFKV